MSKHTPKLTYYPQSAQILTEWGEGDDYGCNRIATISDLRGMKLTDDYIGLPDDIDKYGYMLAAAPDMLEALRDVIREFVPSTDRMTIEQVTVFNAARAALAKAQPTSAD